MSPEEKEDKVVVVVGIADRKSMLLAALESEGFSEEDRRQGDPCRPPVGFHDEEPCQEISSCYDINNGRLVSHTPPFYTESKRDVFRNPKGRVKRRR